MKGSEKIRRLEADVREIKAHIKLAIEKLEKISANHEISSRMEENIILEISGPLEDVTMSEIDGIVENFKYHLESQGEIEIDDNDDVVDIVEGP